MKKRLKTKLFSKAFFGLFVLLSSCNSEDLSLPTVSKQGTGPTSSSDYLSGKWQNSSSGAITPLVISEDFTEVERDTINEMARLWQDHPEDSDGKNLSLEATGTQFYNLPLSIVTGLPKTKKYTSAKEFQDTEMGIYKIANWPKEWGSFALAVTQFFGYRRNVGSSSEYIDLSHADILVNIQNFTFSSSTTSHPDISSAYTFDLPSVVLHELGHFLGLPHVSSMSDSVMVPSIGIGTQKRSPRTLDIQNLMKIYPTAHSNLIAEKSSLEIEKHPEEGAFVMGTIELMKNGECRHLVGGKVIYVHQHMDNKEFLKVK